MGAHMEPLAMEGTGVSGNATIHDVTQGPLGASWQGAKGVKRVLQGSLGSVL